MIPDELEQKILRLHFAERWKVGTIAKQLGVHHGTVRRVLHDLGIPTGETRRPSMVDPYRPFILETLEKYPGLPASRLYMMVVERGYPGAPDHFRGIIAQMRPRKPTEAFQRLRTFAQRQLHLGATTVTSRHLKARRA